MSVGSLLTQSATRYPEKVAVVTGNCRITYRQLNEAANRLAHGLTQWGVLKGTKAAMFIPNCSGWPEIYFALSKIGAVIVPINHRLIGNELIHIIKHSDSEVVFMDTKTSSSLGQIRHELSSAISFISVDDNPCSWSQSLSSLKEGQNAEEPQVFIGGEDPHTISYTSGTTGKAKGAVLTNLNVLIGHVLMTTKEFSVMTNDVFLVTTSLCQRIGWGKLVNSVGMGCKIVVLESFDPIKAMKLVGAEKVSIMSIIPTIGRMILEASGLESYDSSSLRMLFVTGETFPMELKKRLSERFPKARLASYFAQTEAGLITVLSSEDIFQKPGSVGVPFIGLEVRVVDEEMKELPVDQSGEIIVRSYRPGTFGVMKEYYKDPKADQEVFWNDWIRTGDIGKKDRDGHFYVLDRKKDMIISGGFNIYSKEVESILGTHPNILEAAVVGIPDEKYGEAVKAFVVLRRKHSSTEKEIIDFCKSKMAAYKKPKMVKFIDSMPRNTVGKVLKYRLKENNS